jgi:signal transduction histidine kinase/PAS domain-containing protein
MAATYHSLLSEERPGVLHFGGTRMALLDIAAGFWGLRRQMEALVGRRLTDGVLQQAGANGGASFARGFVGQAGDAQALRDCIAAYQAAGFGQFEVEVLDWPFGYAQDRPFGYAQDRPFGYAQDRPFGRALIRARETFEAWAAQQHGPSSESPMCAYTAGVLVGFVNVLAGRHDVACIERACQAQGDETCLFELLPAEVASDALARVVALAPDPALARGLNLLELLFERMPMGMAVLDREYRIQRYNPTWEDFAERYGPPSAVPLAPGVRYFDHLPGTEPTVSLLFERALAGETVRQNGVRLESEGIVTYWDVVLAPLFEDGEVAGILNVAVDATERMVGQQNLERRVEERTRELRTLLQVSRDVNSTLELEPLLNLILDQLKTVVDYSGASILILEGEDLVVRTYRGPIPREEARQLRFPLREAQVNRQVIRGREPVVIPDVRSDTPLARTFRQTAGGDLESTFGYVRSWLGVPLMVKGQMLGMLTLDHSQPGYFSARHADLVLAFANQVAVTIENARLYSQAEESAVAAERNRLARDLHDAVTQTLFSSSLIAEVLPRLWEQDPEEGRRRLQELRELTRGALAEMRTLLLELRPSALVEARLSDLLRQLAESITGRARVPVALEVEGECDLEAEVKVALYRIAQEALNNIAKHAGATQATVSLRCFPSPAEGERAGGWVELTIRDDGIGFDPVSVAPDSLGLSIMRERAEAIGAVLTIESQRGAGTQIEVIWRGSVQ